MGTKRRSRAHLPESYMRGGPQAERPAAQDEAGSAPRKASATEPFSVADTWLGHLNPRELLE
jgi:hypothetical protein